jgi:hypothetical protein
MAEVIVIEPDHYQRDYRLIFGAIASSLEYSLGVI